MKENPVADLVPNSIGLERPSLGQFARQVAKIPIAQLEAALQQQQQRGGRIGEILLARGQLTYQELLEAVRLQASWVATAMHADAGPDGLPFPCCLSVCMPAFNEAENIRSTLEAAAVILPELVEDFELVVVDDGSTDSTSDKVNEFIEDFPNVTVRLVCHEVNRGYGGAVTTGLRAASGELVMLMDSDGQFSLLDLPRFLAATLENDVVVGYRFNRADNGVRRLNAWMWTKLISVLLKVNIRDLDCAFKIFRREHLEAIALTSGGAAINAEIMTQCFAKKHKICELPVMHYPCYFGTQTGANLRVILKAFRELPRLRQYLHSQSLQSPRNGGTVSGKAGNGEEASRLQGKSMKTAT